MKIKYFFHLYFFDKKFKIVYAELDNNTYTKTYLKNQIITIDIITVAEYATALAYNNYLLMKNLPRK